MGYYEDYQKYLCDHNGQDDEKNAYSPPSSGSGNGCPPKKHNSWAKVMTICAACVLGGGLLGGAIVMAGFSTNNQSQVQTPTTQEAAATLQDPDNSETQSDTGKHFSIEDATKKLGSDKTALSVAEIYKKLSPSVVAVNVEGVTNTNGFVQNTTGSASGIIISDDGYIVTNNHVVEGSNKITVKTSDGQTYDATLVGRDSTSDLAVLKIEGSGFTAAPIGDSASLEVGELAVAIGNPLGELANTLTAGFISAIDRSVTMDTGVMNFIQTDVAVSPGNSGGALINSYGELVGITTAKSTGDGVEGIGYAIPISDAMPIIEQLVNNGYVSGRPQIGISVEEITEEIAQAYNWPAGVRITAVGEGTAADEARLMAGDIIVQLNGQDLTSYEDLNSLKENIKVGETFTLTIYRKGEKTTVTVVMGEQPREDTQTDAQSSASEQQDESQGIPYATIPPELAPFFSR